MALKFPVGHEGLVTTIQYALPNCKGLTYYQSAVLIAEKISEWEKDPTKIPGTIYRKEDFKETSADRSVHPKQNARFDEAVQNCKNKMLAEQKQCQYSCYGCTLYSDLQRSKHWCNTCQRSGCYFHPVMANRTGFDIQKPISIPTFIERFGCASHTGFRDEQNIRKDERERLLRELRRKIAHKSQCSSWCNTLIVTRDDLEEIVTSIESKNEDKK